jgi:geranylgeranyl diphosphate synthase, type I
VEVMPSSKLSYNELKSVIEERGNRILGLFGEELVKGINDEELLCILKDLEANRKDSLRPALTSFACEAVGGTVEESDYASLIFTLVSTGISTHDDIIDESPNKHLRLTLLGKYGINRTLLVGDLLIVKGWSKISSLLLQNRHNPEMIANVAEKYGELCNEMCEAEFIENVNRRKVHKNLDFHKNILWKEMAEFEACTRIGALIGGGSNQEVEALSNYGRRLGFTMRLTDEVKDVLNVDGSLIHRLKYESTPLPLLFAAKASEKNRLRIQQIIDSNDFSPSAIRELLEVCFDSDAFTYILNEAKENAKKTALSLRIVKKRRPKQVLLRLNDKFYDDLESLLLRWTCTRQPRSLMRPSFLE